MHDIFKLCMQASIDLTLYDWIDKEMINANVTKKECVQMAQERIDEALTQLMTMEINKRMKNGKTS